jgi:hypothetical protein
MTTLDLGSWCILRTSGADTLRLADRLNAAGILAWTPTQWSVARTPGIRSRYDKPAPIMPGYAFAQVERIDELLSLSRRSVRRGLPRFHLFSMGTAHGPSVPLIADSELNALRAEEARLRRIFDRSKLRGAKPPKLDPGTPVRMPVGAWEGLSGIVESQSGGMAVVNIPGSTKLIKVASCLLIESLAKDDLPYQGTAARAA